MTGVSAGGDCLFVWVAGQDFDSSSPAFVRIRASRAAGNDGRLAQKNIIGPPSLGGRCCVHTIGADDCNIPTSYMLCLFGTEIISGHKLCLSIQTC